MTEQLILTFVITLVAGTTGLYIRDGQNSKKSEDKKLNFVTMVVLNTVFVFASIFFTQWLYLILSLY